MVYTLSPDQTRYLHLRAQRLFPAGTRTRVGVAELLSDVCGVQAQAPGAAALAVWVRTSGLLASQVEHARAHERSIVRTWCMRGTLHLLASADLGWLLSLLGPVIIRKSRRRYAELGLTEDVCARAIRAIQRILGDQGPLTRAELAEQLAGQGLPTQGQAAYHLLRRAGLEGLICFGPERAGEATFVLLEDWVQPGAVLAGDAARAELARRYLAAYAPAGPEDFAVWSGLSISQARAGFETIRDDLLKVDISNSPAWILKSRAEWLDERPGGGAAVSLLPAFDPYLLGYRDRGLSVPGRHARRVHPGGGMLRPTLLVDGWAAGTWKTKRGRDGLVVVVEPFEGLGDQVMDALEDEVRELGRFYDLEATLSLAAPVDPR
jgi:hypothetical protein